MNDMTNLYQLDEIILYHISIDSAISLLSTMVAMLAGILAIILGFSLVAIQSYEQIGGSRISNLILKDNIFKILLLIYGISMSYDLILLRILPDTSNEIDIIFKILIDISILLTFFCLIFLPIYMRHIIERLKPEKIIQGIISIKNNEIIQGNIKINDNYMEDIRHNIIFPIISIMIKTINDYDSHAFNIGITKLKELNIDIIKSKNDSIYKLKIVRCYIDKISKMIDISIDKNDETSVIQMINSLRDICIMSIKTRWAELPPDVIQRERKKEVKPYREMPDKTDNYDMITLEIKSFFSDICNKIIEKKWSRATHSLLNAKGNLMIMSIKERVSGIPEINPIRDEFRFVNDFSGLSMEGKIFSSYYFTNELRNIINTMTKDDIPFYKECFGDAIRLFFIRLHTIEKDHHLNIAHMIHIGIDAAKKNHKFKDNIKNILINDEFTNHFDIVEPFVGQGYFLNDLEKTGTIWICSCLKEIGILYISKEMDEPVHKILRSLATIENNYRHTKSSDALEVTEKIIEIIKDLECNVIDHGLEKSTKEMVNSLILIGMMNENNTIKARVCNILKNIRLRNEELFNSIIEFNEKKEGDELIKFQEFKKFCFESEDNMKEIA